MSSPDADEGPQTDTIQDSFNVLADAKNTDEKVKTLLEKLLKAVSEAGKNAPKDKAEDAQAMARDAEALVKEAASQKPRRKWYELSIEGLKDAATSLGAIAAPVVKIVNELQGLLLP